MPGRKEITDHFQREERRWRTDALRAGLGALARATGTRWSPRPFGTDPRGGHHADAAAEAVTLITDTGGRCPRNPHEPLLLQSLLVRLGALPT